MHLAPAWRTIGIPILVVVAVAFFGLFLPVAVYELSHSDSFELHNVFWESIFGIGFYLAGFIFHGYLTNPGVGLIGMLVWPLVIVIIVFFGTRAVLRSSQNHRILWGCLFVFSLLACAGHDAENYLSIHGLPLFWNLYATWY